MQSPPMNRLAGQKAQFTWALNEYNKEDETDVRTRFARLMAYRIKAAAALGFTSDQVIAGKSYPAEEVNRHLIDPELAVEPIVTDEQAVRSIDEAVDASQVKRVGTGSGTVYAFGYPCAPDRLKIGCASGAAVQRIAYQINASTPDKPVLYLEISSDRCQVLEKAIHRALEFWQQRVMNGGGTEWFRATVGDILEIYEFLDKKSVVSG